MTSIGFGFRLKKGAPELCRICDVNKSAHTVSGRCTKTNIQFLFNKTEREL